MTVSIIRRGTLPEELTYQSLCFKCSTLFTYNLVDTKCIEDRDGTYYQIPCPLCKSQLTILKHNLKPYTGK